MRIARVDRENAVLSAGAAAALEEKASFGSLYGSLEWNPQTLARELCERISTLSHLKNTASPRDLFGQNSLAFPVIQHLGPCSNDPE